MSKLEEAAREYIHQELEKQNYINFHGSTSVENAFIAGAEWQRNNLWIPVSEHLPLCTICGWYSEDVFIFNHNCATTVGYYDKILDRWLYNWEEDIEIEGVTHWMPIPKIKEVE